jgi:Fe-S cluster assembly scaffold protein SufB
MPRWGDVDLLNSIDFDNIYYYLKPVEEQGRTWDDVPEDIKNTFEKLGIPEAERKFLAGVSAQYESEVVYHSLQEELQKQGAVLSEEARDKKQQDIVRKGRERQAFLEDGQAEINRMRERAQQQAQSINNEFQVKVRPIVEEVARAKGYDIVLDAQVAYTISRDIDITRDVIAKADEAAASAAPAAPATPSTPPQ